MGIYYIGYSSYLLPWPGGILAIELGMNNRKATCILKFM